MTDGPQPRYISPADPLDELVEIRAGTFRRRGECTAADLEPAAELQRAALAALGDQHEQVRRR
jgi:hypothetical protein